MATGKQTSYGLAANTPLTIYTVPGSVVSTATVNIFNGGATSATVKIALPIAGGNSTPAAGEWIDGAILAPLQPLERAGIVLAAGQFITVISDTAGVNAVVWCVEG